MKDLTKIKTPFRLLKPKVQKALETHGGPYERWHGGYGWRDWAFGFDGWSDNFVIRVKPSDPQPVDLSDKYREYFEAVQDRAEKEKQPHPIFAAVKEWQEARRATMKTMEKSAVFAAHDRMQASIDALEEIKVPE